MTNNKNKLTKTDTLNTRFDQLIADKNLLNDLNLNTRNVNLVSNALLNVKELNRFAIDDPNKFKFVKTQINDHFLNLEAKQYVYKSPSATNNNEGRVSKEHVTKK